MSGNDHPLLLFNSDLPPTGLPDDMIDPKYFVVYRIDKRRKDKRAYVVFNYHPVNGINYSLVSEISEATIFRQLDTATHWFAKLILPKYKKGTFIIMPHNK